MMLQDTVMFHFQERLAFREDQQIQEMLGIGLEPVITFDEQEHSLSIRGVMELKGEYMRSSAPIEQNEEDIRGTYVEQVDVLSETVNEFFHKLLIDISIPADRVESMDSVAIDVEHFDYKLNSAAEMEIEVNLAISGIRQQVEEVEEEVEDTYSLPAFREEEEMDEGEESFHLEITEEELEQFAVNRSADVADVTPSIMDETSAKEAIPEKMEEVLEQEEEIHEDSIQEREALQEEIQEIKKDSSQEEALLQKEERIIKEEQVLQEENNSDEEVAEPISHKNTTTEEKQMERSVTQEETEGQEEKEPTLSVQQEETDRKAEAIEEEKTTAEDTADAEIEDFEEEGAEVVDVPSEETQQVHIRSAEQDIDETSYLSQLFQEEEDNNYSRLKLYIVQPEDQIHHIAERYQVSTHQLVRTNRLEEEDVSTGQIIYIPLSS